MAKLKIFTFPDVVLAKKAVPIDRVDKSLHQLADDMLETMYHAPGIGLAANQVGILQRILVLDTDYEFEELPEGDVIRNKDSIVVINPEIISAEGSILFAEACLSVPEYDADVKRYEKIKLKYQDRDGLEKTLSAEGLRAVAIQHEIDHLEGRLFIERLSPLKKEMAKKRLLRERKIREDEIKAGIFPDKARKRKKDF